MKELLTSKFIFLKQNYKDTDDLFEQVGSQIIAANYGTTEFIEKLKERERQFPTGLALGTYGVAIPHTDPEYVKQEFIAIITLENPIEFQAMDDVNKRVSVSLIFLLGLTQGAKQLAVLQQIMAVIQNKELVSKVLAETSQKEIVKIIDKKFEDEG